jgi:four helix bundle protein
VAAPTRFEDLDAWKEAHRLALAVYRATQSFPDVERFGLTSQMRRAAVSVPANIAEGFKRLGLSDKIRFYNIGEGSLAELRYYLVLPRDLGYLPPDLQLDAQVDTVGRVLNGLIASTERRKQPVTPDSRLLTPDSL